MVTPGGPDSKGMISREVPHTLGPQVPLINVSRGIVVDEPALIEALDKPHSMLANHSSDPVK